MTNMGPLFPILLVTHIALAISLFVPSLVLPFTLRSRPATPAGSAPGHGRLMRALLAVQARGTIAIGVGLAVTGAAMVAVLGPRILEQHWLLVSLATYAFTAVVAFAIQRPALRRLVGREGTGTDAEREAWRAGARRQRYVAYGITLAVGAIGFLMSTKPALW
jgi:hypothetical protein